MAVPLRKALFTAIASLGSWPTKPSLHTSVWRRPLTWSHSGQPMKQPWLYQKADWPFSQLPPLILTHRFDAAKVIGSGVFFASASKASTELRERGLTIAPCEATRPAVDSNSSAASSLDAICESVCFSVAGRRWVLRVAKTSN